MNDKKRAIFLDRDGVINKEVNYLSDPDDFILLEGIIEALRLLKQKEYLLIVITNQAGIARGYFTRENLTQIHRKMNDILKKKLKPNTNIDIIPNVGNKLGEVRKSLGIKIKNNDSLYTLRSYEHGRRKFSREQLLKFVTCLRKEGKHEYFDFLEKIAKSDIFWDRVTEKSNVSICATR